MLTTQSRIKSRGVDIMSIVCIDKIGEERMKVISLRKVLATIFVLAILSIIFLVSGCCNNEDKLGTLSGIVELINDTGDPQADPVDFAGVTISLYELAELDTSVVRINQQHPYLGVIVQQEMYFDHRYQQPVLSVASAPDGSFTLNKITPGSYNLVAQKDGWGYAYQYSLEILEGENALGKATLNNRILEGVARSRSESGKDTITLYPERQLSGFGTSDLVFQAGRHYVVTDDFSIMPGAQVVFEPNTTIRINPHKELVLYSSLECPAPGEGFFRVVSNDQTTVADTLTPFQRVRIADADLPQAQVFKGAIIRDSYSGIVSNAPGFTVSNCFISSRQTAVSIYNTIDNQIVNCVLCDGKNSSFGAAMNDGSPSATLRNNIIVNNSLGVLIRNSANVEVSNNYFANCSMGILNLMDGQTTATHNSFVNCGSALRNANRALMTIHYNEISADIGISNERDYAGSAASGLTQITANNNNLVCDTWAVYSKFVNHPGYDLDCTNNYWGTTNAQAIPQLIFDSNDYGGSATVYYQPYSSVRITSAGVHP